MTGSSRRARTGSTGHGASPQTACTETCSPRNPSPSICSATWSVSPGPCCRGCRPSTQVPPTWMRSASSGRRCRRRTSTRGAHSTCASCTPRGAERRIVAVECKYAENLAIKAKDHEKRVRTYEDRVAAVGCWKPETYGRLNEHGRQQFMLNVSLAQSLLNTHEFSRGHSVVMACDEDSDARKVTDEVSDCLIERANVVDLRWTPFEATLRLIEGAPTWVDEFRRRYLEDPR